MQSKQKIKRVKRGRRHARVRAKITGTATRPRLSVYRSLGHIYAQLIDDQQGKTLASASDATQKSKQNKSEAAEKVGETIAAQAKQTGISEAVFDRGASKYHGRVKVLAEAARGAGLKF